MKDELNLYELDDQQFNPQKYILYPGVKNAVEVALALGQPLLLTGEPGTGKTKLAFKIADLLAQKDDRFLKEPMVFNTKTTSTARDLFYSYDALMHFQDANINQSEANDKANYIELQAFGKAIAQSNPQQINEKEKIFKTKLDQTPKSTVVLIDEIDKAARDFSNDILNEIENFHFEIKEQNNYLIKKGQDQQIVVVMTSNSEKNLPDAFLRRCVFYHISFPDQDLLLQIIKAQIGTSDSIKFTEQALESIIHQFEDIRKHSVRKKPATAELIAWIRMLDFHNYMKKDAKAQKELMLQNLSILVKTKEDLEAIEKLMKNAIQPESY